MFPVENRLTGQTTDELKAVLNANKAKPYAQRLRDFHLLLFLSQARARSRARGCELAGAEAM